MRLLGAVESDEALEVAGSIKRGILVVPVYCIHMESVLRPTVSI